MTESGPGQDELSESETLPEQTDSESRSPSTEAKDASQGDLFEPPITPEDGAGVEIAVEETSVDDVSPYNADARANADEDADQTNGETEASEESGEGPDGEPLNPLAQTFLKLREGRGRETADVYQDIVKPAGPPLTAQMDRGRQHDEGERHEIGRASCRERV